jgi:hypothetical protein
MKFYEAIGYKEEQSKNQLIYPEEVEIFGFLFELIFVIYYLVCSYKYFT